MKQLNFKMIFGVVILVLVILLAAMAFTNGSQKPQEIIPSNNETTSNNTTNTTSTNVQQTPPTIEGVKVPEGWYTHQTSGIDHGSTLLSRTKELPNNPAIEQIGISELTTSLSPEDYVAGQGGSLDSSNADWSWGIYKGHKTLSVAGVGDVAQWFVYVFGGNTLYVFSLSPNDKTNPNLEKDREDFWKVITYYVQDQSFEKLARAETQQNCKTVTLPEDQERKMQAEPETGYVVVNFTQDNKRKYVYFNYNDDLSGCTPSVKTLLTNIKAQTANKAQ